MKWNKWGSTPHLCTYRLNWVRKTSWGWWDEWGFTAFQTQDSKLSLVGLRPSTLTLGHGGCPQYSIFTIEQGGNILSLWNLNARAGDESAISDFPSRHQGPPPIGIVITYIQTHYLWIKYWFTVRGAAQHFLYFILQNILNVHNIYWSCHCYPLPVIIDSYVFTLVLL